MTSKCDLPLKEEKIMKKRISLLITVLIIMLSINVFAESTDESYGFTYFSYDGIRKVIDHLNSADYHYGYIDEEGNVIAKCKYDAASDFINGIGILKEGSTIFAINTKGETIKTFDSAFTSLSYYDGVKGIATKDGLAYIIDKDGNIVSKGYQELSYDPFSNFSGIKAKNNDKYGVIAWDGSILTPFDYVDFWDTGSTTTGVLVAEKQLYGLGGYIGINGKVLLPPVYDFIGGFSEDRGRLGKDGKYGVIDAAGNQMSGLIYDNIGEYAEGLAAVLKDGKWGYINKSGNLVIPCIYTGSSAFTNGYAEVYISENKKITIESPIKQRRKINVYINNKWLFLDQEPVLKNERTLAPLRGIAEALDYIVDWDASTNTAILQDKNKIIQLTIGDGKAKVNIFDDGIAPKSITLDVSAININGRILVPVRFIAENIGAEVSWDQDNQRINIKTVD